MFRDRRTASKLAFSAEPHYDNDGYERQLEAKLSREEFDRVRSILYGTEGTVDVERTLRGAEVETRRFFQDSGLSASIGLSVRASDRARAIFVLGLNEGTFDWAAKSDTF